MSNPAISIVTPVWNGLPYIKETITSVLSQPFQDWELLVGDNGSTDGTIEYLKSLDDQRINIHYHEKNLGIFGNLNFLLGRARAPVSYILCADDFFLPGKLDLVVHQWENQPDEIASIRFNLADINSSKCECVKLQKLKLPRTLQPSQSDLFFFLFGNIAGNLANMSVRTQRVSEVGWFDTNLPYAGDFDFWVRLTRRYPMFISDEDVVYVRRHAGTASNYLNTKGELIPQTHRIVKDLFTRLASTNSRFLLRLYATANYDALARHTAVKKWLKDRDDSHLVEVNRVASSSTLYLRWLSRWAVYFLTGGGHWGRASIAKIILKSNERPFLAFGRFFKAKPERN